MKIKEKTVDWVCKIMREDADKNKKKDNPDFGYLPSALRVRERLQKSLFNIPKKDLNNKNKRTMFLIEANECADMMLRSFDNKWTSFNCYKSVYEQNKDLYD